MGGTKLLETTQGASKRRSWGGANAGHMGTEARTGRLRQGLMGARPTLGQELLGFGIPVAYLREGAGAEQGWDLIVSDLRRGRGLHWGAGSRRQEPAGQRLRQGL